MDVKKYNIVQILVLIGMAGAISLVIPIHPFDLDYNIFALPTKNVIAFFAIVAVSMGFLYLLRKRVKEVISDERQTLLMRKAAYYTFFVVYIGFSLAMLALRAATASDPVPEMVLLAKVFSVLTGAVGFTFIGFYYFFNYKN